MKDERREAKDKVMRERRIVRRARDDVREEEREVEGRGCDARVNRISDRSSNRAAESQTRIHYQ